MSKFIIQGGKRLEGEVKISGSKNAALPIIAATILNGGKTTLYNVPDIQDVQTMFEIIKDIGGAVIKNKNKFIVDTSKIHTYEIPDHLMRQMRSSVILAGALIGKYHKARFSCPGDCDFWWIHCTSLRKNKWIRDIPPNSIKRLDFFWIINLENLNYVFDMPEKISYLIIMSIFFREVV